MKVKYRITMEVEVEVDAKEGRAPIGSNLTQDLANYAELGFIGRTQTRHNAVVNKVKVTKIGATGVTPKDLRHGFGNSFCHSLVVK